MFHPKIKAALGVAVGIVVAMIVVSLFSSLSRQYYPSSAINPSWTEYIEDIKTLPLSGFLLTLGGYISSTFFGAYVAARIAPSPNKAVSAGSVGFFMVLVAIVLFFALPHPIWFVVACMLSFVLFSFLAFKAATYKMH